MKLDNKQKMIIYKVTNLVDNKLYIGRTSGTLRYRYRKHLYDIKKRNTCPLLYNAIRKYGINNFKWETIDIAYNIDDLNNKEKYYIKLYNSNNKDNGYNLTEGGESSDGYKHTDDVKNKLRAMKKELSIKFHNSREYKLKYINNIFLKEIKLIEYYNSRKYKLKRINEILIKLHKREERKKQTQEKNNNTIRNCPNCGKEIKHTNYYAMKDAEKKKRYCLECNIVRLKEYGRSKEFLDMMYKINNSEEHKNKIKAAMKNISDEAYERMIEGARKGGRHSIYYD